VDRARKLFSPQSEAIRADSLLEREQLLIEQFVGVALSRLPVLVRQGGFDE
jgi:hypothetical protein